MRNSIPRSRCGGDSCLTHFLNMPSFTPLSTSIQDGQTVVTAIFSYGDVEETQTYTFDGALNAEEVLNNLTTLTQEYQAKWDAQQAAEQARMEGSVVLENDVNVPLVAVEL